MKTGSLEMLELVVVRAREQMTHDMLQPPHESHTAQEKKQLQVQFKQRYLLAVLMV
jgi:hypothetical protein